MRGSGAGASIQKAASTGGQGQWGVDGYQLGRGGFDQAMDILIAERMPDVHTPPPEHTKPGGTSRRAGQIETKDASC
jgi:hypothetical protein